MEDPARRALDGGHHVHAGSSAALGIVTDVITRSGPPVIFDASRRWTIR
ncbi:MULTISPECIES: hypothetical protein [unclassified Pseudofrankia]|nr:MULTISPECIES: hypothetical protein [unclassified Pseudofrankia]MDT3442966.1 hypothetical protein [Pseudofrankia sp. BMG5.37]